MLENNFARAILFIPVELSSTEGQTLTMLLERLKSQVYTQLADAVNKELNRDRDTVEARSYKQNTFAFCLNLHLVRDVFYK